MSLYRENMRHVWDVVGIQGAVAELCFKFMLKVLTSNGPFVFTVHPNTDWVENRSKTLYRTSHNIIRRDTAHVLSLGQRNIIPVDYDEEEKLEGILLSSL
ncbi:hypothetical protein FPSE_02385 [Fusarium pseudograminearum CS3096]|uniref:Uncharacterized protein n=1 Tax=Fusarium pseudograminearum (strain CS3096) TaxID=1028729 RepID=K3VPZ7_FUSPC|nr:hypothetical protein FPSE_02385 [Fusarium pseudograminearum CS3096]EKJ77512.1 hypothetical protein FPSE_02385 [Fusarium pseudograminearum CS3096]